MQDFVMFGAAAAAAVVTWVIFAWADWYTT